jgi:hypothetical protein
VVHGPGEWIALRLPGFNVPAARTPLTVGIRRFRVSALEALPLRFGLACSGASPTLCDRGSCQRGFAHGGLWHTVSCCGLWCCAGGAAGVAGLGACGAYPAPPDNRLSSACPVVLWCRLAVCRWCTTPVHEQRPHGACCVQWCGVVPPPRCRSAVRRFVVVMASSWCIRQRLVKPLSGTGL